MPKKAATQFWLMKSEPGNYSIDDLASEKTRTTCWDGVRNYQARNIMRDLMKKGDKALFYHSNAKPSGVVGVVKIVSEAYPDHTAFDANSKYFDPKSNKDEPRWVMVDVQLVRKFKRLVSLEQIKNTKSLGKMVLLNNSRLSVQPVTRAEFETIVGLASAAK